MVFVPNASTGINTVLRNLVFGKGDVILRFSTVCGACEKTVESISETTYVEKVFISIEYLIEDDEIVRRFISTAQSLQNEGKNVRIAMFDIVLTFPGVRFLWEELIAACKTPWNLESYRRCSRNWIYRFDTFRTDWCGLLREQLLQVCKTLHFLFKGTGETDKMLRWLFVPRGCAVLYVPFRNQNLIRTTFPTSHGVRPLLNSQFSSQ